MAEEVQGQGGVSGSTLKIIAVVAMLIDHAAAVVLWRMHAAEPNDLLWEVYEAMRSVGRLGFPIFCFLLAEGFQKTGNVKKYILRMGMFALVSEIPFDLAFAGQWFYPGYQNVYFTLLLGLLALCVCRFLEEHIQQGAGWKFPVPARVLLPASKAAVMVLFAILGDFLRTDYGGMGVLTICVMYAMRRWKALSMAAGCGVLLIMSGSERPAFLAVLPVAIYNGRRGLRMKYFFYAFYPAHLFLLYLIALLLGLGKFAILNS